MAKSASTDWWFRFYRSVLAASDDAVIAQNERGEIISWNHAAEKLFGYPAGEMIGQPVWRLYPSGRVDEESRRLREVADSGRSSRMQTVRRHRDGSTLHVEVILAPITDDRGRYLGMATIARDLSDRIRIETRVWRHEHFDALTGLPNRQFMLNLLHQELHLAEARSRRFAVIMVDVDLFHRINETFGHEVGDELLVDISQLISGTIRKSDTVGRTGVDEFLILMPASGERSRVEQSVRDLQQRLAWPLELKGRRIEVSASVGYALYPDDGAETELLLKRAQQALRDARARAGHRPGETDNPETSRALNHVLHDLSRALERNQVQLLYRPVIDLRSGRLSMGRALPVWVHPSLGSVGAAEFLPVAQDHGLAPQFFDWLSAQLSRQLAFLGPDAGMRLCMPRLDVLPPMADGAENPVPGLLAELGKAARKTVLEVPESSLLNNAEVLRKELSLYKRAGLEVLVSDFGTGYSSLGYLQQFHVDYIRIKPSFIEELEREGAEVHLCEAMVLVAHKLGLRVVAEGVHSERQLELLKTIGCDFAEGEAVSSVVLPEELPGLFGTV